MRRWELVAEGSAKFWEIERDGSAVTVRFGDPILPDPGESARTLGPRIRTAVASLLDEETTTWWEAQRRAATGTTPDPSGPADQPEWRRVWDQLEPVTPHPEAHGYRRPWRTR